MKSTTFKSRDEAVEVDRVCPTCHRTAPAGAHDEKACGRRRGAVECAEKIAAGTRVPLKS